MRALDISDHVECDVSSAERPAEIERNGLCAMRADAALMSSMCSGRSAAYAACRS